MTWSEYRCGTCDTQYLRIVPRPDAGFDMFCANGHPVHPVPGTEYRLNGNFTWRILNPEMN
jgi:hypothetical protein